MTEYNDQALVKKILQKDADAFEILVRTYERLVAHMVYRLIDNADDRLDICQDVFVKVYQALPSFRFDCKLSTWIAKIAYRKAVNVLEKKRAVLYEDIAAGQVIDELPGSFSGPEQLTELADQRHHLEEAISGMNENFRVVLTLYHWEGMSYSEIGEIMKLPEGTVKSHLFRARKVLKDIMIKEFAGEEL